MHIFIIERNNKIGLASSEFYNYNYHVSLFFDDRLQKSHFVNNLRKLEFFSV